jgi:hypothetical protein
MISNANEIAKRKKVSNQISYRFRKFPNKIKHQISSTPAINLKQMKKWLDGYGLANRRVEVLSSPYSLSLTSILTTFRVFLLY